jgi:peptide/nickel transport system substrate-binding protein
MNKKLLTVVVATATMTIGIVGVGALQGGAVSNPTILTEETNVGVTFTNNFNPADSQSTSTQMATNGLSYEPLIQYDSLKPTVWYPWIATKEVFNSTGQSVTFTINPKAVWSNGVKLTAQDVANEFNALNTNGGLNVFGVPTLAAPATHTASTVTLTYTTPQFSNKEALGGVLIFPVTGDPGIPANSIINSGTQQLVNTDVVGSGPYLPTGYSGQQLSYTLSPHWNLTKKPYVTGVNIPYYASNQAATESLAAHQLDWAGNDIPQIQQTFVNADPKHNHFYYPAGSTVTLWFNTSHSAPDGQRDCLADPNFRYAISMAVDRSQLASIGETGFEQPATSSSGMTPSQLAFQGKYKNNLPLKGWTVKQVTKFLISKGYTLDSSSYWQVTSAAAQKASGLSQGTECTFSIQDPTGYSDYAEDEQLISASLQGVHINVNTIGVTTGQWNANIFTHQFDAIIHWGAGGSNPYSQFQNWLADPGITGGSTNYGEYANPIAQQYLVAMAATQPGTPAFQAQANKLSAIMTKDVPVAPILYGADWDVYSTARFTGWVTPSNQYAYPGPGGNSVAFVLTRLTKATK